MNKKPNVVIVTCHDIGTQFGCCGDNNIKTPAVDKIAHEGIFLKNYFATSPLCSPARSSFITSKYPHSTGMNGLTHRGFELNSKEKKLADYFNEAGYFTALFGVQHETENVSTLNYQLFDLDYDHHKYRCKDVAIDVSNFLENYNKKQPFLLSIGFSEAHRPFSSEIIKNKELAQKLELLPYMWDSKEYREELSRFYHYISLIDEAINIIDTTIHKNFFDNTIFIFTSDHGIAFPRAKSTLYHPGTQVVFAMRYPQKIKPQSYSKSLVSSVDVLPTLSALCGLKVNKEWQGHSFEKLFEDVTSKINDAVFSEKTYHGNEYDPMRSIFDGRYKYIRNYEEGYLYQCPLDIRNGLLKNQIEERRNFIRPPEEFYDLLLDPNETKNLISEDSYSDILLKLKAKLAKFQIKTGDSIATRRPIWPDLSNDYYPNNKGGIL